MTSTKLLMAASRTQQVSLSDAVLTEVGYAPLNDGDGLESVAISGNYAFVVGNGTEYLYSVDISDPTNPTQVGRLTSANIQFSSSVTVANNHAFVAGFDGVVTAVVDVGDPANMVEVSTAGSSLSFGHYFNDSGVDIVGSSHYSGTEVGFSLADVSLPIESFETGAISDASVSDAYGVSLDGDYAYVAYGPWTSSPGVWALDISDPSNIVEASKFSLPSDTNPWPVVAAGGHVFVGAYSTAVQFQSAVISLDASDPTSLTEADTLVLTGHEGLTGLAHDTTFLFAANQDTNTLVAVDVEDPAALLEADSLRMSPYDQFGSDRYPQGLAISNGFAFVASYYSTELVAVALYGDVKLSPKLFGEVAGTVGVELGPDGTLTTYQSGASTVYPKEWLAAKPESGAGGGYEAMIETLDGEAFTEGGLAPDVWHSVGSTEGLLLESKPGEPEGRFRGRLKLRDASTQEVKASTTVLLQRVAAVLAGSVQDNSFSDLRDLAIVGDYALVVSFANSKLIAVDISAPTNPFVAGALQMSPSFDWVAVDGDTAFLVGTTTEGPGSVASLFSVDVSALPSMSLINRKDLPAYQGSPHSPAIDGSVLFVGVSYGSGVPPVTLTFDITDPSNLVELGSYTHAEGFVSPPLALAGNYVVQGLDEKLVVLDASDPSAMSLESSTTVAPGDTIGNLVVDGGYAYATFRFGDLLAVIDISDLSSPAVVGTVGIPGGTYRMAKSGNYVILSVFDSAQLVLVDVSAPTSPSIEASFQDYGELSEVTGVAVEGGTVFALGSQNDYFNAVEFAALAQQP